MFIRTELNISTARDLRDPARRREGRREAKMALVVRERDDTSAVLDSEIPDLLVTEPMIDRHLALNPPHLRVPTEFDVIVNEIERAYVLGLYFSALAASVVTIERLLNEARKRLHRHAPDKGREWAKLYGKGALTDWDRNIEALLEWRFLEADLASELRNVQRIRNQYLHSEPIPTPEADARRCVDAAFCLLREFLGVPARLHLADGSIDTSHPLFEAFYKPEVTTPDPVPPSTTEPAE